MCGRSSPPGLGIPAAPAKGDHAGYHRSARDPDPPGFPADTGGLRGVPAPEVGVGAPAAVPDLRARRVLRLLPAAARPRSRLRGRPPGRAVVRAGRELALVLCRRNLRLIAGTRLVTTAPGRARRSPARSHPNTPRIRGSTRIAPFR